MSARARSRASVRVAASGAVLAGVVSVFAISGASAAFQAQAQAPQGPIRLAQVLEEERTGVSSPVGLAFSSATKAFYVLGGRRGARGPVTQADIATLTPFSHSPDSDRSGSARIAAGVLDPINIAFDPRGNRLLLLSHSRELLEVRAVGGGDLDRDSLNRHDATGLELQNPQGVTVDPSSGVVYVLDAGTSSIVRVEPDASGSFATGTTSAIDLGPSGLTGVRGIAFDPATGNLHVGSGKTIYELTTGGVVVSARDLSGLEVATPEGMVFAPSGDSTDAPSQSSLYVADSGTAAGTGQIVELSLAAEVVIAANFTSQVVRTIDTAAFSPPSPDPSGLTYLPQSNTLLMVDGEVEETVNGITHFQGVNVWEFSLLGNVVDTANVSSVAPVQVSMTNEPVGVTWKPSNGHFFISEDGGKRVYDLNPGADGRIGSGDSFTSFGTNGFGNGDPEGIAYNPVTDRLFVCDGVNAEIYQYTTTGSLVSQFDTQQYGVLDPETVEYNADAGTLFILSNNQSGPKIIETTTAGALLNTIDVSAATPRHRPAGLAYAPASNGSGVKRFYWVDREIDNNNNPNAVDGKLFEMTAPGGGSPPPNQAPTVSAGSDQTVSLSAGATLDGTVSDDGLPSPPGTVTTTWSMTSGPAGGTVTFGNASAVDTTATFSQVGTYVLRLTASDSALSAFDELTVTVNATGGQFLDVRVSTGQDDAEQRVGSAVNLGNADLDMMTADENNAMVGVRFLGVAIPPRAIITNAYVQFQAAEASSVGTSLTITGQAADNPLVFAAVNNDLSSRPKTTASQTWPVDPWLAAGNAGLAQRSPSLAAIVQEIVNRSGWASGNALALFLTGSGQRVAVSHNGTPAAAPLLHVEWVVNQAPVVDAGLNQAITLPSGANLDGTVTDDGVPAPPSLTTTWSQDSGPVGGTATFANASAVDTTATFNLNGTYVLRLTANDGNLSASDVVTVVVNANTPPAITSDGGLDTASVSAPENQTAVTTVTATDPDAGTTLTYSISSGADAARFAIVPSTGVLTFLSAPDFEAPTDTNTDNAYLVTVQASDGSLTDTQALTVSVTNQNEAPLITSDGGGASAAFTVDEGTLLPVTDVNASDPDGTTPTYALSGPDRLDFTIGVDGVLSFVAPPDFETPADEGGNNVYEVTVEASDGSLSDAQALTITVRNLNEAMPVIAGGDTASVSAAENQTAVTDVDATDADGDAITYSIAGGVDALSFAINSSTGVLTFVTAPNYEAPADTNGDNDYLVTVQASAAGDSDTQALTVTVTNVNEAPLITSDGGNDTASFTVDEGTLAPVTDVNAIDPDAGTVLVYSLSGPDMADFTIDANGVLSFVVPPDFESPVDADQNNVYGVTVRASDGSLFDTQVLTITVRNLNEAMPVIGSNGGLDTASVSAAENQSAVTTVTATDADGDAITYSISTGADAASFAINASTGVLTFVSAPNFEAPTDTNTDNDYLVTVQASAAGDSDTQALTVTVTNVNEAPLITSDGGGASAVFTVDENTALPVTDVNASDPDGTTPTYALSGPDALDFTIDVSGVLRFAAPPDFEAPADAGGNNVYEVTVEASDGTLSDTQALTITVRNLNEAAPVIGSDGGGATATKSAAENQSAVTTVTATDADGDAITYSISTGADAASFAINASTGVLTFVSAPNYEAPTDTNVDNAYLVTVRASAAGDFDEQALTVSVTNENEAPVITSDGGGASAAFTVDENTLLPVTDVNASDPDAGTVLGYSLSGPDMADFTIDGSGVLTFVTAPNFEAPADANADNVYELTVRVSDGSLFDEQALTITVRNLNEAAPVIGSDGGGATATKSAAENQTAVTTVTATDADAGTTLAYSITGGADAARFAINASTGVLTFVSAPDFEAPADAGGNNVYDVTVRASDGTLFDEQAIAVTVTDVAESTTSLYFSLRAAATVGGVAATNEDVVFFNGTVFSLAFDGGDVGLGPFRIDAFSWVDATRLLLSFDVAGTVPGIAGTVDDSDVVLFTATSLGQNTAGAFSMYFQGADVGFTADAHDIDAVELLPGGHILISTAGTVTAGGVTGLDEDLLRFVPISLGLNTAGSFSMYFDGSDVDLSTNAGEDVDAAAVDAAGKIYLSTADLFSVTGVSGADEDVFVFTPTSIGSLTAGTYSPTLYFDGSVFGLDANDVFAIDLP